MEHLFEREPCVKSLQNNVSPLYQYRVTSDVLSERSGPNGRTGFIQSPWHDPSVQCMRTLFLEGESGLGNYLELRDLLSLP
jgi:hypothetical protein